MKEFSASEFKANCLNIIARVSATGTPVLVSRYGKTLVKISVAKLAPSKKKRKLGTLGGRAKVAGDITGPIIPETDWEILR